MQSLPFLLLSHILLFQLSNLQRWLRHILQIVKVPSNMVNVIIRQRYTVHHDMGGRVIQWKRESHPSSSPYRYWQCAYNSTPPQWLPASNQRWPYPPLLVLWTTCLPHCDPCCPRQDAFHSSWTLLLCLNQQHCCYHHLESFSPGILHHMCTWACSVDTNAMTISKRYMSQSWSSLYPLPLPSNRSSQLSMIYMVHGMELGPRSIYYGSKPRLCPCHQQFSWYWHIWAASLAYTSSCHQSSNSRDSAMPSWALFCQH